MARKPKYNEKTKQVGFKCPESKVNDFRFRAFEILDSYNEQELDVNKPPKSSKKQALKQEITENVEKPCGCVYSGKTEAGTPIRLKKCDECKKAKK